MAVGGFLIMTVKELKEKLAQSPDQPVGGKRH
jgi:hypothetical protein